MKRALLASAFAMMCLPAFANPQQTNGGGSPAQAQVYGDGSAAAAARSNSKATAHSKSNATGGTSNATGGTSRATGGNATGGHAQGGTSNVSVSGGGGYSGGGGGVFLSIPDGHGEAPCGGGIGLGGGGSNAGGGVGGTLWEFADCKRMRESAALERLGYHDAATAELCQIDRVRQAMGGECPTSVASHIVRPADYCMTRNAGDANQHLECDSK